MRSGNSQWGNTGGYCFQLFQQPPRQRLPPLEPDSGTGSVCSVVATSRPAELKPPSVSAHVHTPDWGLGAQSAGSRRELQQFKGLFFHALI